MAWMATAWIKGSTLGGARRKAVMLAVADGCSEDLSQLGVEVPEGWVCCPAGLAKLAADAEVSRSTVKRVLADMEAAGVIRRESRYRTWGDGGRTSDLIWMHIARPWVVVAKSFHAPAAEVSQAHREASSRGGLRSAEARRLRAVEGGVMAQVEPGVGAQPEPGYGLTTQGGMGSPLNRQEPQVEPAVEPQDITLRTYAQHGAGARADQGRVSSSGSAGAAAPPAAPSDEIRARALGSSRGRRRA